jgi:hypothetical protein
VLNARASKLRTILCVYKTKTQGKAVDQFAAFLQNVDHPVDQGTKNALTDDTQITVKA